MTALGMIEYLPGGEPSPDASSTVEFVGGPWNGERQQLAVRPESIAATGGIYRQSVTCADDGALRYVWVACARIDGVCFGENARS